MIHGSTQEPGREAAVTLVKTALAILVTVMVGQALVYLLIQNIT